MKTAALTILALLCSVFTLGGCGGKNIVKGKVIAGNLSFACVVDQNDERLKSPGLPDVDVESRGDGGRSAGTVLAKGRTNEKGDFAINFHDQAPLMKNVLFSGSAEGFIPASESMMIPPTDRRVLIILKKKGETPATR